MLSAGSQQNLDYSFHAETFPTPTVNRNKLADETSEQHECITLTHRTQNGEMLITEDSSTVDNEIRGYESNMQRSSNSQIEISTSSAPNPRNKHLESLEASSKTQFDSHSDLNCVNVLNQKYFQGSSAPEDAIKTLQETVRVHKSEGNIESAVLTLEKLTAGCVFIFGTFHPETQQQEANLALAYDKLGRVRDRDYVANQWFRHALQISAEQLTYEPGAKLGLLYLHLFERIKAGNQAELLSLVKLLQHSPDTAVVEQALSTEIKFFLDHGMHTSEELSILIDASLEISSVTDKVEILGSVLKGLQSTLHRKDIQYKGSFLSAIVDLIRLDINIQNPQQAEVLASTIAIGPGILLNTSLEDQKRTYSDLKALVRSCKNEYPSKSAAETICRAFRLAELLWGADTLQASNLGDDSQHFPTHRDQISLLENDQVRP